MPDAENTMTRLHRRLVADFGTDDEMDIRLLPDSQMLISKHLAPNPSRERGGKAESLAPSANGYQVYVSERSIEDYTASGATSQRGLGPAARPVYWDATTMELAVSGTDPSPEWRLVNPAGRVVTINVKSGSANVVDEVNSILAEVAAALLS